MTKKYTMRKAKGEIKKGDIVKNNKDGTVSSVKLKKFDPALIGMRCQLRCLFYFRGEAPWTIVNEFVVTSFYEHKRLGKRYIMIVQVQNPEETFLVDPKDIKIL